MKRHTIWLVALTLAISTLGDFRGFAKPPKNNETQLLTDLSIEYIRWLLEIPFGPDHPLLGGDCNVNQQGDVFFLASVLGGTPLEEPELRFCEIEVGKSIFVNPIESTWIQTKPPKGDSVKYVLDLATADIDAVTVAEVLVNDQPVEVTRLRPRPFRVLEDNTWLGIDEPGATFTGPAGVDGYWALIEGLPVGFHTIEMRAFVPDAPGYPPNYARSVIYCIEIVERVE